MTLNANSKPPSTGDVMRLPERAFSNLGLFGRRQSLAAGLALALCSLIVSNFALADDVIRPRDDRPGPWGLIPGVAIGVGAVIGAGKTREDVVQPEFCYTHKFGQVITCKKRSARGQTCNSQCDLIEDGVDRGKTPPPKAYTEGSKYECQCQDP
jgi:hypothetical protein